MNPETVIVNKITRALKADGAFIINIHGSVFQHKGLPDLIVIIRGTVIFLEVKTPTGKPSPMQLYIQGKIRRRGVESWIVSSVEEAERAVRETARL